jgi:hypothetical protein
MLAILESHAFSFYGQLNQTTELNPNVDMTRRNAVNHDTDNVESILVVNLLCGYGQYVQNEENRGDWRAN